MFSRQQQLRVLTLMTIFVALAQASWFNSNPFRREVAEKKDLLSSVDSASDGLIGGLVGSASSSTPSASSESSKTTSTPSPSSTPTPTTTPSSSPTPSASSSTPTPTDSSTSDTPTPTPTPTATPTPSDHNSQSQTTTTQITVAPNQTSSPSVTGTQSSAKPSNSASLAQNGSSSSSSMSAKTKSTVVGVVVGIGGAIVLAGLAIVAFRIWGRRKNEDDSDGLMGFRSGSAGHEKSTSSSGNGAANPFQSTLENYHNPARNVNASSNF